MLVALYFGIVYDIFIGVNPTVGCHKTTPISAFVKKQFVVDWTVVSR